MTALTEGEAGSRGVCKVLQWLLLRVLAVDREPGTSQNNNITLIRINMKSSACREGSLSIHPPTCCTSVETWGPGVQVLGPSSAF